MSKVKIIILGIVSLCIVCLIGILVMINKNDTLNDISLNENNELKNKTSYSLIPLKFNKVEKITGAELIYINNYKVTIKKELVDRGYKLDFKDNVLRITSDDNKYKCVMFQISDNYIMPTEEEINAFYETDEYKEWNNEEYDYDNEVEYRQYWEKYDEISTSYYKGLGYNSKNSPNFVLTSNEQEQIISQYVLEGEVNSSGSKGLFPGYEYYKNYDWGKVVIYTIPKYYNDETFGQKTSDFSACIYFVEYFDENEESYVNLWTL